MVLVPEAWLLLPGVGKPEERGLSGAEPQLRQVHHASAAVGAKHHLRLPGQRRTAQLQPRLLPRPVEGGHVALALIPGTQVRQRGGGVREEQEVPKQQGALLCPELAGSAEEAEAGQTLRPLLLEET